MSKSTSYVSSQPHPLSRLQEISLGDLLSESSRKEKRALLGSSILVVAISYSGFLPTKISALGVELQLSDQRALLLILSLVVLYFLISFLVYAFTDFIRWRAIYTNILLDDLRNEPAIPEKEPLDENDSYERALMQAEDRNSRWIQFGRKFSLVRAIWDFCFPIVFALYAIIMVLIVRSSLS